MPKTCGWQHRWPIRIHHGRDRGGVLVNGAKYGSPSVWDHVPSTRRTWSMNNFTQDQRSWPTVEHLRKARRWRKKNWGLPLTLRTSTDCEALQWRLAQENRLPNVALCSSLGLFDRLFLSTCFRGRVQLLSQHFSLKHLLVGSIFVQHEQLDSAGIGHGSISTSYSSQKISNAKRNIFKCDRLTPVPAWQHRRYILKCTYLGNKLKLRQCKSTIEMAP